MSRGPYLLVPLAIGDAMIDSHSIAEPDTGETAWVSAGTYALGDVRIRTATHRKYKCHAAHSGRTAPPEDDIDYWTDIGPTNAWAMFDNSCSTRSTGTTSFTVVLRPGFFNAVEFIGLVGTTLAVTVKDAPGGNVLVSETVSLDGPYLDEWEWCWGPFRARSKYSLSGIPPSPDAEITFTVSSGAGSAAGLGMFAVGDLRPLVIDGLLGGTRPGAAAEPVDYSYIKIDEYGEATIRRRHSATDIRLSVVMPREQADYALATLQEVLGVPVVLRATDARGFDGLLGVGLVSGSARYERALATLDITLKGLV